MLAVGGDRGPSLRAWTASRCRPVRAADLILLKPYAGGPQDAWDIQDPGDTVLPRTPSDRRALLV